MKLIGMFHVLLGVFLISGCSLKAPLPSSGAADPAAAPTPLTLTPTSQAPVPAGWSTFSTRECEYAISYPADMHVTGQGAYSRLLAFQLADPDAGARNFIYISVITTQIREMIEHGAYDHSVYNYDPMATDTLLNMQVGESQSVHQAPEMAPGFTFLRLPDREIGGYAAQAYENVQPWEFPPGTKEVRYMIQADGCAYLIGGYMDTAGTHLPGAISEDLFHQLVATVQLLP